MSRPESLFRFELEGDGPDRIHLTIFEGDIEKKKHVFQRKTSAEEDRASVESFVAEANAWARTWIEETIALREAIEGPEVPEVPGDRGGPG